MPRPVILFSGPWADLPLEALAAKAAAWKYDGFELGCWGDHLEVQRGLSEDGYRFLHGEVEAALRDVLRRW